MYKVHTFLEIVSFKLPSSIIMRVRRSFKEAELTWTDLGKAEQLDLAKGFSCNQIRYLNITMTEIEARNPIIKFCKLKHVHLKTFTKVCLFFMAQGH